MGIQVFPSPEVAGGGLNFEFISSINMATGSPASISFTGIDAKYKTLKLVIGQTSSSGTRVVRLGINGSTAGVYGFATRRLVSSTWTTDETAGSSSFALQTANSASSQSFEIYFFDTNLASPTNLIFNGTGGGTVTGWGCFNDTAVVNSIEVKHDAAQTFSAGTAYLLGSES
jgi:hypothetical protein